MSCVVEEEDFMRSGCDMDLVMARLLCPLRDDALGGDKGRGLRAEEIRLNRGHSGRKRAASGVRSYSPPQKRDFQQDGNECHAGGEDREEKNGAAPKAIG